LEGWVAEGTLITKGMFGAVGAAGLKTPPVPVSRNTSLISPMYQCATPVPGTPGGAAISCTHSGTPGMSPFTGALVGMALSWVRVVMVLWVVNAQASATFFRGNPCEARLSKSGFNPARSCSRSPACASLSTLIVLCPRSPAAPTSGPGEHRAGDDALAQVVRDRW
jgi:hypothetical protein